MPDPGTIGYSPGDSMALPPSLNFAFLAEHDPLLPRLGALAERNLGDDPNTTLLKLRQMTELLAVITARYLGVPDDPEDSQFVRLDRLERARGLPRRIADLFHALRRIGNDASHQHADDPELAAHALRLAHQVAVWFHRSFASTSLGESARFRLPDPPSPEPTATGPTDDDLAAARTDPSRHAARALEVARLEPSLVRELGEEAAEQVDLTEADTRRLIDQQLRAAGWECDSIALTWASGARPQKGKHRAIAEVPTDAGSADYILYLGERPVAAVEAKRSSVQVPAALEQAKRYSRTFRSGCDPTWGEYHLPLLFATNGRPFHPQLAQNSGIWFLDAREPANISRALEGWYTPEGIARLLEADAAAATRALASEPTGYLGLRDYQLRAVAAAEDALARGQRRILLAMATGTGKTRTLAGLAYRLLKTRRFRRMLFLVDRRTLGDQTHETLQHMRLEQNRTFSEIFEVRGLDDAVPESGTRVHLATVQGLLRRIHHPGDEADIPPVDAYDLVVVDECHRGYLLDRDQAEGDLEWKSEEEYLSLYRRVVERFDATWIGLTATPALHTAAIFGDPVFQYTFPEAVADGWLCDQDPPVRITTRLGQDGIHFEAGTTVETLEPGAQRTLWKLPDDLGLDFDLSEFHRKVVNPNFNRVVLRELVRHIDPALPGKTLIFASRDDHADLVVQTLKEELHERYGTGDDLVVKITGSSDRPNDLIKRFRNEEHPKFAVTVDLLTTGVDIPRIVNLVFLRTVASRILFEQMLGRATRRADEIGKEAFQVYDAADVFQGFQGKTAMRPVAAGSSRSLAELVDDLGRAPPGDPQEDVRRRLVARLQRTRNRLRDAAAREQFESLAGRTVDEFLAWAKGAPASELADALAGAGGLVEFLSGLPSGKGPVLSTHPDELVAATRGYGPHERPEDYLSAFAGFVRDHLNEIPAMKALVTSPRSLKRQDLKEIHRVLAEQGFQERSLETAWRETGHVEIAATVLGFIRQSALGSPLVAYAERVDRALRRVLSRHPWTESQRAWLRRLADHLKKERVADRADFDQGAFARDGGYRRLDKAFDGKLTLLLDELVDEIWKDEAA